MASAHQADGGVLTVSVDLDLGVDLATFEQARALDATTNRLLSMFDDLGIAATWSVADPAHSRWTERLTSAGPKHEVAVVGETSWADGQASRRLFVRQLQQQVGEIADQLETLSEHVESVRTDFTAMPVPEKRPKEWISTVIRDDQGFIDFVEHKAKEV